jgi:hypothetical protein
VSPIANLIAMRMERRALARLRRSCGLALEDDGRPGASPGLVLLLCILGMVAAFTLGIVLS